MTKYLCWCPEHGGTREDAREIEAHSHESAATEWAERFDAESADYLIVGGQETEVFVAESRDNSVEHRFNVTGESVPSYRARLRSTHRPS